MVISALPVLAFWSSVMVPVVSLKRLRCFEKPRWVYSKLAKVWVVSML